MLLQLSILTLHLVICHMFFKTEIRVSSAALECMSCRNSPSIAECRRTTIKCTDDQVYITKPAGFDVFHINKSCVVFFYTCIFFYFVYLVCFFTVDFVVRISMSLPRLPHHCYVPVIYHVLSFFTLMLLLLIYY